MKPDLDSIPDSNAGPLFAIGIFGLDSLLGVALKEKEGVDLNGRNELGQTPVYLAASAGRAKTVSKLVDRGADINIARAGKYGSPLHAACVKGYIRVVEILLGLGVDVTCGSIYKDALQAAFLGDQEEVALRLSGHEGVVETEEDYEHSLEGAARSGFLRVVRRLQSSPFILMAENQNKADKLKKKVRKAIEGGEVNVLRQFLNTQATNENALDVLPPDSVCLAVLYNRRDMVEFLLGQDANIEAEGTFGTPLRTASLLNSESLVRILLDRGADVLFDRRLPCGRRGRTSKYHDIDVTKGLQILPHTHNS
ncbi:ankyrin repeat-containing domain protein [Apiospora saccharicola]|uniref:Ankyrin repeat-containing domain protein n=1 Tax=Apiospora saccharicola TaxID=335842 RepID=A0ABR1VD93_9PEZI